MRRKWNIFNFGILWLCNFVCGSGVLSMMLIYVGCYGYYQNPVGVFASVANNNNDSNVLILKFLISC